MTRDRRFPYEWELKKQRSHKLAMILWGSLSCIGLVIVILAIVMQNNYNV